jgi:hypothetical protein
VHAEVYRKDLLDAPIGHGIDHKHGAGSDFVFPLSLSFHGGSHLPNCDPARGFDAALNHVPRRIRFQVLSGVIRLLRPLVLNEFDATPVGDNQAVVTFADDDQGRPARMSFHSEGDFHLGPEDGIVLDHCHAPSYRQSFANVHVRFYWAPLDKTHRCLSICLCESWNRLDNRRFQKADKALAGPRRFEMVQKIAISGYDCQWPE